MFRVARPKREKEGRVFGEAKRGAFNTSGVGGGGRWGGKRENS